MMFVAHCCPHRCTGSAWPEAHAVLKLQLLAWCPTAWPEHQAEGQGLQLVGFGSSSHCNLQAEFACAATEASSSHGHGGKPACGKAAKRKTARNHSSSRSGNTWGSDSAQQPNDPTGLSAASASSWLIDMLCLLPACAQQPLLLRDTCSMLSSALQAQGAVQSAALLLQLSLGRWVQDVSCMIRLHGLLLLPVGHQQARLWAIRLLWLSC